MGWNKWCLASNVCGYSYLCDYSYEYILVKGTIVVAALAHGGGNGNKEVAFKNFAP